MKKMILFSWLIMILISPFNAYASKAPLYSLSRGLARTVEQEPLLLALAGYTLACKPEWLHEHPYITAGCAACLLGSCIRNTFAQGVEFTKNSLIKTAIQCPFSVGLATYALCFNRELISQHPVLSALFGVWLAMQWAQNVED